MLIFFIADYSKNSIVKFKLLILKILSENILSQDEMTTITFYSKHMKNLQIFFYNPYNIHICNSSGSNNGSSQARRRPTLDRIDTQIRFKIILI